MDIRYAKIIKKTVIILFFLAVFLSSSFSLAQAAGIGDAFKPDKGLPLNKVAVEGAGFNTTATYETIIGKVVTMAITIIGVVFLILAIYAGYTWMTAHGNEEMVTKARSTLIAAIIGLVIVLAAYAISSYIINSIGDATLNPVK
jgi:hypothetical protein